MSSDTAGGPTGMASSSPAAGGATVTVYLVGAGPGDPGLLTLAGAEALRRADVVVYDYLANARLLELAPASAEKIYVGKTASRHTLTQEQINALLVEKARELSGPSAAGRRFAEASRRTVVRLKGGDPYVFGRGGEEGEALRAAGVGFVTVPGITSGIAAPNYAGIPVTHRDFATTLTLVTGHEKEDAEPGDERVNFGALAQLAANGTLCFYMGVKSLPSIRQKLLGAGLDPATPAAVIRWGTHPHQRTVTGTVGNIVEVVAKAGITAPAMTIIGRVVSLRETLNWFEGRPLFGRNILVTRTRQQASELTASLAELGANVLEAPTLELAPPEDWAEVDHAIESLTRYDWVVFTSANGVRATWERLRHHHLDARAFGRTQKIAAIGPATAEALEAIGLRPNLVPEKFVGEELALALRESVGTMGGRRFLLLRADIARPVLREELQKAGATVDDVAIYRTMRPASLPEDVLAALGGGGVDWITFTSASTAVNLYEMLPAELREKAAGAKRASIGPITTAALNKLGWPPTVEASQHDIPGLAAALAAHCKET